MPTASRSNRSSSTRSSLGWANDTTSPSRSSQGRGRSSPSPKARASAGALLHTTDVIAGASITFDAAQLDGVWLRYADLVAHERVRLTPADDVQTIEIALTGGMMLSDWGINGRAFADARPIEIEAGRWYSSGLRMRRRCGTRSTSTVTPVNSERRLAASARTPSTSSPERPRSWCSRRTIQGSGCFTATTPTTSRRAWRPSCDTKPSDRADSLLRNVVVVCVCGASTRTVVGASGLAGPCRARRRHDRRRHCNSTVAEADVCCQRATTHCTASRGVGRPLCGSVRGRPRRFARHPGNRQRVGVVVRHAVPRRRCSNGPGRPTVPGW